MDCETFQKDQPWITPEVFQNILNKAHQNVQINDIKINLATIPGQNYSSQLLNVKIIFQFDDSNENSMPRTSKNVKVAKTQQAKFIVKASLKEKLVRSRDVFAKEIYWYNEIIPKIEILFKNTMFEELKVAPICHASSIPDSYLILEDLMTYGYRNIDRKVGLNYFHLKAAISHLAKWHAGSIKLVDGENKPQNLYKMYERPHICLTGSSQYRTLLENAVTSCAELFQESSDFKEISQKLFLLKDNIFEKCCSAVERDENGLNVLTHGDLWMNNIMFKCDDNVDGALVDVLFIDFQMGYWGSPVFDLAYLLFTSSDESIAGPEWDKLVEFYYDEFVTVARQLKISPHRIPSKDTFLAEVIARGGCPAIFSLFTIPLLHVTQDEANAVVLYLANTEKSQQYRRDLVASIKIRTKLESRLKYFDKQGFLN